MNDSTTDISHVSIAGPDADPESGPNNDTVYELIVPEDLQGQVLADAKDPLFTIASEWANAQGVSQDGFNQLTAAYYAHQARESANHKDTDGTERAAFIKAFGGTDGRTDDDAYAAAQKNAQHIGDWVSSLIAPTLMKHPGVRDILVDMASFSDGILLLKALKESIGEQTAPGRAGGAGIGPNPRSPEEILYGKTTKAN